MSDEERLVYEMSGGRDTIIKNKMKMYDSDGNLLNSDGVANGDTTKHSDVYTAYQKSVKTDDRLKGSWTLGQYEKAYTRAMYNAVKAANPDWKIGQSFDSSILSSVTRESVEAKLVQSGNTFITKSIDYSI